MKKTLYFLALLAIVTACDNIAADDQAAAEAAQRWAEAFFGCDYHQAEQLSTPESRRWLLFAASNTTQHDLDLVNGKAVEVSFDNYFPERNDTMATVRLGVSHYLKPGAIGRESTLAEDGIFDITVVKRNDQWLVRMEGLPRSGKQSRD